MNIFDLDMNSLPEQVQNNKEDIKDIKDNLMPADLQAAKDYADAQDAIVFQNAKDYTDNHVVDSDHLTSGTATSGQVLTADGDGGTAWDTLTITDNDISSGSATAGQVLTADGNGDAAWQNIPPTTAAKVDSETATNGQVLTADGNGGASWQAAGGGGSSLTLIWSGSSQMNNGDDTPFILSANKTYLILCSKSGDSFYVGCIVKTTGTILTIVFHTAYGTSILIGYGYIDLSTNKYSTAGVSSIQGSTVSTSGQSIYIREIYEVN